MKQKALRPCYLLVNPSVSLFLNTRIKTWSHSYHHEYYGTVYCTDAALIQLQQPGRGTQAGPTIKNARTKGLLLACMHAPVSDTLHAQARRSSDQFTRHRLGTGTSDSISPGSASLSVLARDLESSALGRSESDPVDVVGA